jgi:hypothetical protein
MAALMLCPGGASARSLATAQRMPEYQRILFASNSPQQMRMESRGNMVVLILSEPTGDVSALAQRLKPHVTAIERSPDGKRVTLTLDKNYRLRQFVSGNTVGVDILTTQINETKPAIPPVAKAPAPPPAPKKPEPPVADIMTTKPQTPLTAPAPAPAPPASPVQNKATPPVADIMTTKPQTPPTAPAPAPAPAPPASPVQNKAAPPLADIMTTKPASPVEPAPASNMLSTKPVADSVMTTKAVTPPPPPSASAPAPAPAARATREPVAEVTPAAVPEAPEAAPPAVAPTVADSAELPQELMVGVENKEGAAFIRFPWTARTAGAVFRSGNDIWMVFNRPAKIDTVRLGTVLPTSVLSITRYQLPGHTVLRLETDGTLYPNVDKVKNSYEWRVGLLKDKQERARIDTVLQPNAKAAVPYLLLKAADVSPPVSFMDPLIGDRWMVVPVYEIGEGLVYPRRFPEFELVPSVQGLAIKTLRPDLTLTPTRAGLRLSAKNGIIISNTLPFLKGGSAPVKGSSAAAGVLLPYDLWYVKTADYRDTYHRLESYLISAPKAEQQDVLYELAGLNFGQGLDSEAVAYLTLIRETAPEYYKNKKLALVRAAANFMAGRMEEAAADIKAPELAGVKEAALWKEVIGMFVPPKPLVQGLFAGQEEPAADAANAKEKANASPEAKLAEIATNATLQSHRFDYLKYQDQFIRYYPPDVRRRLALIAAENYIKNSQHDKAVTVLRELSNDGLFEAVQPQAEYLIGVIAREKGKANEAKEIFTRLAAQEANPYIRNRAEFALIQLEYKNNELPIEKALERFEAMRMGWRGDAHERELLNYLGQLYRDNQQYDMALRTWKELMAAFPNDPKILTFQTRASNLFANLFLEGKADEFSAVKALALFYEFRELTPLGARGNLMIQKLADRLAALDLLDSAAELLKFQVESRIAGEERARVGAHLALIYLMNKKPDQALSTLESTHYGEMNDELRLLRLRLSAKAFFDLNRNEEALAVMAADTSPEGEALRIEILWKMRDWPNMIQQAERMLAQRKDLTAPLNEEETQTLLKLALAYSFEKDMQQLKYLRDYYTDLMQDSRYKDIFNYLTNYTNPLDPEDFALVSQQISGMENFMQYFREKITKGALSETTQSEPQPPGQ